MQVHSIQLSLRRQPEHTHGVDSQHYHHRNAKRGKSDRGTADELGLEQSCSSTIEETFQGTGIVRTDRTGCAELSGSKQAERQGSPNTADTRSEERRVGKECRSRRS